MIDKKNKSKIVLGPETNKDSRSFRPSSIEEINQIRNYQPLAFRYTKKDGSPGQCSIGCGSSGEDIIIIVTLYITFYSFCLGFFTLALKGAIDTEETGTLLWAYLYILLAIIALVAGTAHFQRKSFIEKKRMIKENEANSSKDTC